MPVSTLSVPLNESSRSLADFMIATVNLDSSVDRHMLAGLESHKERLTAAVI